MVVKMENEDMEQRLRALAIIAKKKSKKSFLQRYERTDDIFERGAIIRSQDLDVTNFLGKQPVAAWNPGAINIDGKSNVRIYPRLNFDNIYNHSPSSIGEFEVDIEAMMFSGFRYSRYFIEPFPTKIILYPDTIWELDGCEDARVDKFGNDLRFLYTGYGRYYETPNSFSVKKRTVLALAKFSKQGKLNGKGFFKIRGKTEDCALPNKDAVFLDNKSLKKASMLTRFYLKDNIQWCWSGEADIADFDDLTFTEDSLKVQITATEFEDKVGWSTNSLKISSNEYLVGWHGILKKDLSYRNGLAVVDKVGDLLAISDEYLLAPKGIEEIYGNRCNVVFGNGLLRYKENLVWVGGISDLAIRIFYTDFDKAMSKLKWIKK